MASQSLEVKKLVYLYLLHYAEKYAMLQTVISEPLSEISYDCFEIMNYLMLILSSIIMCF